jgi:DNA-directed RNA polymerase specialized sigma24 family protein
MDEYVFNIIDKISNEHCGKKFGYLDENDLKNEIWIICLEKLPDFNEDRGNLEHFLRVTVKNRLINRFKDITKTVKSPCHRCPYFDSGSKVDCARFGTEKDKCDKWRNYQLSLESRNSLLNATEEKIERVSSDNTINKMITDEMKIKLEKVIDRQYLHDFNLLVSGGKLSKQKLKKLKKEITKKIKLI